MSAPLSVILTADPGDFSGTSEAHYIIDNLKNVKIKARDSTVCGSYYQGLLMGQPVLVVTTGTQTTYSLASSTYPIAHSVAIPVEH